MNGHVDIVEVYSIVPISIRIPLVPGLQYYIIIDTTLKKNTLSLMFTSIPASSRVNNPDTPIVPEVYIYIYIYIINNIANIEY